MSTATITANPAWPTEPYRGLSYYGYEDAPVFGGRKKDVQRCARLLSISGTRLLLLHGPSGCGKSSFLRAGLIPYLERSNANFEFINEMLDGKIRPVFVRATDSPIRTLAETVWNWCRIPRQRRDPDEEETILPLADALNGVASAPDFMQMAERDPLLLVVSLEKMAAALPSTLVIIIDQAEEVFSLKPKPEGEAGREPFFKFIRGFVRSQFDLKLIATFRTEYFGQFDARINESSLGNVSATRGYSLPEFDRDRVVEAIELPTRRTELPGLGAPYQQYGFSYAENVPGQIADRIEETFQTGKLAAMQIVCRRLYELTREQRESEHWEITAEHLELLGGVEGQVDAYVTDALVRPCRDAEMDPSETLREIVRWRSVLYQLAYPHADGTVTTSLLPHVEIAKIADSAHTKLRFDNIAPDLSKESPTCSRVLLRTDLIDPRSGRPVANYSLAHDVLGLTLLKWHQEQEKTVRLGNRVKTALLICALCLAASGGGLLASSSWPIGVALLTAGAVVLVARFTIQITDWLTGLHYYSKTALFLIASQKKRAAMIQDRRFRVYLDMLPGRLRFMQRFVARGVQPSTASNYWFRYTESDTVLIFVHGLFSSSAETWKAPASNHGPSLSWPELIATDDRLKSAGIFMAGYYTSLRSGAPAISDCANTVFAALNRREPGKTPVMGRKKLLFVCHGYGSSVLKYVFVCNQSAFQNKNIVILFIGSSSYGPRWIWLRSINRYLSPGQLISTFLEDIDRRFALMLHNHRIPNLTVKYAVEGKGAIAQSPATQYSTTPIVLPGVDHLSSVRPDHRDHVSHLLLVESFETLESEQGAASSRRDATPFLIPPLPATPLIRRSELLARILQQLQPGIPVALYGAPGSGKTSLALQAAHDPVIRQRFAGGILGTSLANEPDPIAILGRWCAAFGIPEDEIEAMKQLHIRLNCLQTLMADRAFLIVMDDVESLNVLESLMPKGRTYAALITTRTAEIARSISPDHSIEVGGFTEAESLTLLSTLGVSSPEVASKTASLASGVPLSVALLGRLAVRHGAAAAAAGTYGQLQSEEHAVRLSIEALSAKARQLLRTLAELPAKPNTFSQSAALTWTTAGYLDELTNAGLLEALGAGRWALDREVWSYIRDSPERPDAEIQRALAEYFIGYAETHQSEYGALEYEALNIGAALQIALSNGWMATFIKGALSFGVFLEVRGTYHDASALYIKINTAAQQVGDTRSRILGLIGHGRVNEKLGHYQEAKEHLEKALGVASQAGDINAGASALAALGVVLDNLGETEQARSVLDEGLRLDRAVINTGTLIDLLERRGRIATHTGQFDESDKYNGEALEIAERCNDQRRVVVVLTNISMLRYFSGNLEQARVLAKRGLGIAEKLGYTVARVGLLQALGLIAAAEHMPQLAESYYDQGMKAAEGIGHRWYAAAIGAVWGDLLVAETKLDHAEAMYQKALGYLDTANELWDQIQRGLKRIEILRGRREPIGLAGE